MGGGPGGGESSFTGIVRITAQNPSPMTLDGTNSYVVDGWVVDPGPADEGHLDALVGVDGWVVDPGPADEGHLDALVAAAGGALEGIVLTHDHPDHSEGAPLLSERAGGVPVVPPEGGTRVGPFEVVATPGHSPDSVCLVRHRACFTGDTILGEGSVFVAPGSGALAAYLDSLRRLRELDLTVLCPGHGDFVVDVAERIDGYIEHRLERERRLLAALDAGVRGQGELLDVAWSDVPAELRAAARVTLEAHMEKLRDEGRLPSGL